MALVILVIVIQVKPVQDNTFYRSSLAQIEGFKTLLNINTI